MSEVGESAVETAFVSLLTAIDAEIELVNEAGALAFQSRDYQVVAEAGARQ